MSEPKYLYHGTSKKITGNSLLPKLADDLEMNPDNMHCAVYASSVKEIAIAMAIISSKGVRSSSLTFENEPFGVIYEGWPKQKYVFIYYLPVKSFEKSQTNKRQWISYKPVRPTKIQKVMIADFIHLIRSATAREKQSFFRKHGRCRIR